MNYLRYYSILIITGLTILAWPEQNNQMLIKFSETHGPSWLDTLGLLVIVFGYVPMIYKVVKRLNAIREKTGKTRCSILILISVFFLIVIPFALYFALEPLLWISVINSAVSQAILIYYAFNLPPEI